jgi:PAS domain S-box-containing protein
MSRRQRYLGFLVALLAAGVILLLRQWFSAELAEQARLLPFVVAVMLAARIGGMWPGIFATFLAAFLALWFIVPPSDSLRITTLADGLNLAIFLLVGMSISLVFERLHQARRLEGERQFHVLADSVPQLLWIADAHGKRIWFNQRWYEYTGTSYEQVAGSRWRDFCAAGDVCRLVEGWQQAVTRGEPWEATYRLRRHDGALRWFLARAVPLKNRAGGIERWFGTSTDIQDRIEAEQRLREADQRKDRYLAILGHELRNPLTPLSNALQLWPRVAHDPHEIEELRCVMTRQVKQLVRLVDDLLDVSRISQGKIVLRRIHVELNKLVNQAVETAAPLVQAKSLVLRVEVPPHPIVVDGDRVRLLQIFSNLLNNAAKYTPEGGSIGIALSSDGPQARVRVYDEGCGIPADVIDKIFEPFFQVERTIDSSQGGLGIGLTLARQLAHLHGGEIEARSAGPGKGSEFVLTLPALPPDVAATSELRGGDDARLPRLNVLIVDDIADSADTFAQLLRSHGHRATAVHDGLAALAWVEEHDVDCVIIDIAMPGLDGYEVARRMRSMPRLAKACLVALTGFGQPDDKRRALEAGFNAHLTKPVTLRVLECTLMPLLAARREVDSVPVST